MKFINYKLEKETTNKQITTPANPTSWYNKLYFKSDWKLYKLDNAWVETEIGTWWAWTNTGDQTISIWTITATWWQTIVSVWTYAIWNNKLQIFVNWLEQLLTTDYTETSTTSITFTSWLTAWDIVKYRILS